MPIRPRLIVNTSDALVDAALAGAGLVRPLSYQGARHLSEKRLSEVLTNHAPEASPVHVLHTSRGLLPLKLRRFLEYSVPKLREALS